MSEIVNRVQSSGLLAIDLADYLPKKSELVGFDFAPLLWNELILKEKDFRAFIKDHDWSQYTGKHVYLFCASDAILPSWSYMLVSSKLIGIAASVTVGSIQDAKQAAMTLTLNELELDAFQDAKIIVKGCSDIPNPHGMMALFLSKVQPVCSSLMYGEPCSTVPVYKKIKEKSI